MPRRADSCPLPYRQAVDLYFMEHRAKLLDVAAFLDRLGRTVERPAQDDFRVAALREAIALLGDGKGEYARRILDLFSDPGTEPIATAGEKGASGAYPGPTA